MSRKHYELAGHGHHHLLVVSREAGQVVIWNDPGAERRIDVLCEDLRELVIQVEGRIVRGSVRVTPREVVVSHAGRSYVLERIYAGSPSEAEREEDQNGEIVAPMTGTVIEVHRAAGDTVEEGDALVTIEAMKMEHRIIASARSLVRDLHVAVGAQVDIGQILATLDPVE